MVGCGEADTGVVLFGQRGAGQCGKLRACKAYRAVRCVYKGIPAAASDLPAVRRLLPINNRVDDQIVQRRREYTDDLTDAGRLISTRKHGAAERSRAIQQSGTLGQVGKDLITLRDIGGALGKVLKRRGLCQTQLCNHGCGRNLGHCGDSRRTNTGRYGAAGGSDTGL